MLAVVEHEEEPAGPQALAEPLLGVAGPSLRAPSAPRGRRRPPGDEGGVPQRAELDQPGPVRKARRGCRRRRLEGEPGLAGAPDPGQRDQAGPAASSPDFVQFPLPGRRTRSARAGGCAGGSRGSAAPGSGRGRSGWTTWKTRSGRDRSASRCSPRSTSPTPAGARPGPARRRPGSTAPGRRRPSQQPGGTVEGRAEVVVPRAARRRRRGRPSAPAGARPRPTPRPAAPAGRPRRRPVRPTRSRRRRTGRRRYG